jgi:Trk K+ transport system NAD-binding subunit
VNLRAILVGAGGIGRAVLERLGDHWNVTAIDIEADRLAALAAERPIQSIHGDGSSRVTLERAGLTEADAVIVALRDDDIALEVCRLARAVDVPRVVAMVVSASRVAEFNRLGVTAVAPDRLAARQVELTLEPRRVASAAFADGRAEAIEFRLAPDSKLAGRKLAELGLQGWLVAAVLRDGEVIVPHGGTVLAAGDRVTVVGPAANHAAMVRVFTESQARFPLSYGRRVGVLLRSGHENVIAEAMAFSRLTAADALVVIHPRRSSLDAVAAGEMGERLEALRASGPRVEFAEGAGEQVGLPDLVSLRDTQHLGCLVVPKAGGLRSAVSLIGRLAEIGLPSLLSAGATHYERLVIPARDSQGAWEAAWVALDLAAHNAFPIEALGASTPRFLVTDDDEESVREAVTRLRDEGSVRTVEVVGRVVRSNPIRLFRQIPSSALLVLGLGTTAGTIFRPAFTAAVAAGLAGSLLVVPPDPARRR